MTTPDTVSGSVSYGETTLGMVVAEIVLFACLFAYILAGCLFS